MTAPELKPCPFCAGEAAVWTTYAYSGDSAEHVLGCKSCNIYVPFAGVFNSEIPTQDDVTAWNTRTPDPAAIREAALREAAEAAKAALNVPCLTCGVIRAEHHYRHPFVPSGIVDPVAKILALIKKEPKA